MTITFRQFLSEGGKAMAQHGTSRATAADILSALSFVSKTTGIPVDKLKNQLLGSTAHTLAGKKADSGDIDIAITNVDREEIEKKMLDATGIKPRKTGGNVLSYAVPVGNKKVQVDLVFAKDLNHAKFSYFAVEDSAFKSAVRNILIFSLVECSGKHGQDAIVKDKNGNVVATATLSWKLGEGLKRVFKIAPLRKDGDGRVKTLEVSTPEEVAKVAKDVGYTGGFSHAEDLEVSPTKMAEKLLGKGATEKDLSSSAEDLIKTILRRRSDARKVLETAFEKLKEQKLFDSDSEKLFKKLAEI